MNAEQVGSFPDLRFSVVEMMGFDLRHTFATMMIAKGTDIRTVADWLGHASPSMTLDVYADVALEAKRDLLDKMKACFDVDMDGVFGACRLGRQKRPGRRP